MFAYTYTGYTTTTINTDCRCPYCGMWHTADCNSTRYIGVWDDVQYITDSFRQAVAEHVAKNWRWFLAFKPMIERAIRYVAPPLPVTRPIVQMTSRVQRRQARRAHWVRLIKRRTRWPS